MSILVVGTNSYVTVEEADTYVQTYYLDTDSIRIQWLALSADSKEVLLVRSLRLIDAVPYTSQKVITTQILSFPRNRCLVAPAVPESIKQAQIEEALSEFNCDAIKYRSMRLQGISAYTIAGLSETFKPVGGVASALSPKAQDLVRNFVIGGYRIC